MLSTKTIACCLAVATLLTVFTSCRRQAEFFQPQVVCVQKDAPVAGASLLLSNGLATVNYDTAVCGFMPMHKDAFWIYTDSMFNSSGVLTSVSQDTIRVKGVYKSPSGPSLFWRFTSRNKKGFDDLMYTTDSMLYAIAPAFSSPAFYREFTWAGYPAAGYPGNGAPNLGPSTADTIFTANFLVDLGYSEKIVHYRQGITVPAGSYSDCIGYHKFNGFSTSELVFKPGLGMVQYKTYYPSTSYGMYSFGSKKQVSVLTGYHLF